MTAYYRGLLPETDQTVYDIMLHGLEKLDASFFIPPGSLKHLSDIFFRLRLDHPEIFYAVNFKCRTWSDTERVELIPEYMFDRRKISAQRDALKVRIRKLCQPAESLDDIGKEKYIHDFICRSVTYDKLKKPYSHEIIGPLQNGVGVCEGIAKTVKILCDTLGLSCIIAISEAETGSRYLHAWNLIKIQGNYHHLDTTFDNTLSSPETTRYDYFNLCDAAVFRDHNRLKYPVPSCPNNKNYYYRVQKQSFAEDGEVLNRFLQALKKKKKSFVFQWRAGYLTREKFNQLVLPCIEAARKSCCALECKVNFPQAVVEFQLCSGNQVDLIEQDSTRLIYGEEFSDTGEANA